MSFGEAIHTCFVKYATFSGRAARPEYWYWVLFTALAGLVFIVIEWQVSAEGGKVLSAIFDVATFIPSIAVAARRLHDTDRSGWWQLLALVPIIGWILLLIWMCQRGTPGGNRFGFPAA
jgi:uncharacterized membrane protein YhaH (DUF805 family)